MDVSATGPSYWYFQQSYLYNVSTGLCVFPLEHDLVTSFDDIIQFQQLPNDLKDDLLKIIARIQNLDLTPEENTITAALTIMVAGM